MSKKITISVPDELYEKMSTWKSSFNFSKVFQNAIASMILKKEEFSRKIAEEIDISSIVERLKNEKLEVETNFRENGKKDGFEWSKTAHYKDLQYALAWMPGENPFKDDELGDYFKQIGEKYRLMLSETGRAAQSHFNEFTSKYVAGWKEGVETFWNEVKDKL